MSRVFEALQRSAMEKQGTPLPQSAQPVPVPEVLHPTPVNGPDWQQIPSLQPRSKPESRLVSMSDPGCLGAEKFRVLAARLRHLHEQNSLKTLLVTSSGPGDGKSFISGNLALTMALRAGNRALLVEGDLRRPMVMPMWGLPRSRGLSDYLQSETPISDYLYRVGDHRLWLLPAGSDPDYPLDLLHSGRLKETMAQLRSWFDWVIIDAPPLLPLADASLWSRCSDGVLVVVRQGKTKKKELKTALHHLDGANVIGAVMNDADTMGQSYYYSHYSADKGSK